MKIINVNPGILPIPPNGWGAVEKIIWEYHQNFIKLGHESCIEYLNDVKCDPNTIVHIHVANLALIAKERGVPYYFTCHDHHAYLYGKNSTCFKENYDAIKHSIKSFVPAKYLVDYFDLPNLEYLSHGVNSNIFKKIDKTLPHHKLLCVANNGFIHDASEDRKGFGYAIEAARILNLPITIAGPSNNNKFFEKNKFDYDKLNVVFDLTENELVSLYQDHTIFLSPSILEAGHPNLTLLESMSCGLPVISTFEENNNLDGLVKITRNVDEICCAINEVIGNYDNYQQKSIYTAEKLSWKNITNRLLSIYKSEKSMKNQLIDIYENTTINHRDCIEETNKLSIDFNKGCKVEITGTIDKKYNLKFIDNKSNSILYDSFISNNMWSSTSTEYFIDWKIEILELDTNSKLTYNNNLNNKLVRIINESPSLGDYVAWMPYIEEFRKKHNCVVDFYTPNKELFEKNYNDINFYNYNESIDKKYHATYRIGCFNPTDRTKSPKDYRTQNLQQVAAEILGLDYTEIIPNIVIEDTSSKLNDKYVCISTASTAGCKHWQNKDGWQQVVDYLNTLNYKVVVLQKEPLNYMDLRGLNNVIHPETKNIQEALTWLYNCEFFVGLSSGVSWLAWCLKKPVLLISGFTKKFNEFYTPYRVINENVCNGCWNDINNKFDGGDWNWCPKYKDTNRHFECSKQITFEMVKKYIDNIHNIDKLSKKSNFDDFAYTEIFEWNQYDKFVTVENKDVVVDLGCSKGYFYFKHQDKNIKYIGIDGSTDCIKDFLENLNGDKNPLLLHALIGSNRNVCRFESMFHNNNVQSSMTMTFEDVIRLINTNIDFLKFDIEGHEYSILNENYDLFKKHVYKFAGEVHFGGEINKQTSYDTLKKLCTDVDLHVKLFSVDGVDITEYFWTNSDYYTEIILAGYKIDKKYNK